MIMDISGNRLSRNLLFREIIFFDKSTFSENRLVGKSIFRKRDLSGTPIFSENRLFEKSNFGGIDFPGSQIYAKSLFQKIELPEIPILGHFETYPVLRFGLRRSIVFFFPISRAEED